MSIFGKLFKKKDELNLDLDSLGTDNSQKSTPEQSLGLEPLGGIGENKQESSVGMDTHSGAGLSFRQPEIRQSEQPRIIPQVSQTMHPGQRSIEKDIEVLSLKMDALRAEIDALKQQLNYLIRILEQRQGKLEW